MPTEPPPGRYRVIEKGRRLVVIDTQTGAPVTREHRAAPDSPPSAAPLASTSNLPERIAFDGRSTLMTKPFYDLKAPRTVQLDPGATRVLDGARSAAIGVAVAWAALAIFFPWMLLPLLTLLNRQFRLGLRRAATQWLDRYDPGGASRG